MKSFFRFGMLAALVVLMAVAPVATKPVQAQGGISGLTPEIQALLAEALAKPITSFAMEYDLSLKSSGIPSGDVDVTVKGTGAVDLSKLAGAADPTAALKNLVFQHSMDASVKAAGQSQSAKQEHRIVSGVLYVNDGKSWQKLDLTKLVAMLASNPMFSGMPMPGGAASPNPQQIEALTKILSDPKFLKAVTDASKSISVASKAGPKVDNLDTTQIDLVIKLSVIKPFLSDPELLKALITATGQEVDEATLAQLPMMTAMVAQFDKTLQDSSITLTVLVGTKDKFVNGLGLAVVLKADPSVSALISGGASTKAVSADFNFLVKLSKLNQAVKAPDVPADAKDMVPGM